MEASRSLSRRTRALIVGGLSAAIVIVAVIVLAVNLDTAPPVAPEWDDLPLGAATPEEITVEVDARPDGRLAVSESLVFDTPAGSDQPVFWTVGGVGVGWVSDDRSAQYVVLPQASEVTARELAPDTDDPAEAAPLTVDRDDSEAEDLFSGDVQFSITPEPENGRWSAGRHAVQIDYVLDDVFVEIAGEELLVLPLRFPGGPENAESYRRVSVPEGSTVLCLPGNITYAPDEKCDGLRDPAAGDGPSHLAWARASLSSIDAIAFEAPDSVTAEPTPVTRQEKR